jgi:adenosine kinase
MKPILISGSLVYDRIMDFPGHFKDHVLGGDGRVLNLSFVVDRLVTSRGGTAGNIAHTVKLLGGEPIVVGALGTDGADYLAHFASAKISTRCVARDAKHLTASAHIITDRDDNQITAFFSGTAPEKTPRIASVNENTVFATISPAHKQVMKRHLRECAKLGMTTMFDPGQQINAFTPEELREMVRLADIVIGNDYEIAILQERTGWDIKEIMRRGDMLIITRGSKGSVIYHREEGKDGTVRGGSGSVGIKIAASKPKRVVDPTGAGDAYRAGFLVGLAEGRPLAVAGRMGSVAASYAIETSGTQEHTFTKSDFWSRYKKNYGPIEA